MKNTTKIFILVIFFFMPNSMHAQKNVSKKNPIIQSIKVGSKVPDFFLSKVLNDENISINLHRYKEKLLILDFWSTSCSACIAQFPKMSALQKEFKDKIKILTVTQEQEAAIKKFFQNNTYGKETMLPTVVEDKILHSNFKHWAEPHEVWIYKGEVVAITSGSYVTAQNIQYILDGKKPKWPIKDEYDRIDYTKKSILDNISGEKKYSYIGITGYKLSAQSQINSSLDTVNKFRKNTLINVSIGSAYSILWGKLGKFPNNFIFNVKDQSKYQYDPSFGYREEWNLKNMFCYESITPDRGLNKEDEYCQMLADLDRLLGLTSKWEQRKIPCLVLIRTSNVDKIMSKQRIFTYDNMGDLNKFSISGGIQSYKNFELNGLLVKLLAGKTNKRLLNETKYIERVDMNFTLDEVKDLTSLRKALQKYDLDLQEMDREFETLVLSEI